MYRRFIDGEPCWVEASVIDPVKSAEFYRQLFNWDSEALGPEFGNYTLLSYRGATVGALGYAGPQQQPWWTPYFKTSDARALTQRVETAGGSVDVPATEVPGVTIFAVCTAPDGAGFAVSQSDNEDMQLFRETGGVDSVTLLADAAAAFDFYETVFGWELTPTDAGFRISAARSTLPFGDMHVMDPALRPAGAHPSWTVNFAVTNIEACAKLAAELGAMVHIGPMTMPDGIRTAFLSDPDGAGFSIMEKGD